MFGLLSVNNVNVVNVVKLEALWCVSRELNYDKQIT
jgi:hypothetical protein